MLRGSPLLLSLIACSIAPIDLAGKRCPCPSGWACDPATDTCVRELDDAGVDADCAADGDGDTIDDCRDNCPADANELQHDEDGDARGDVCDLCPGDPDDGANSDGDGVGDACDPNPQQAGERIVLFEGFHSGIPQGWTGVGAWAPNGDDVEVTSGPDVISSLTLVDPVPGQRSYLIGKVTIGTLFDPTPSTGYAGLVRTFDPVADTPNIRCLIGDFGGPQFGIRDTGGTSVRVLVPYAFATGMTERFVFGQDGTNYTCSNATHSVLAVSSVTTPVPELGLRTRSTSASYAWMMLVIRE